MQGPTFESFLDEQGIKDETYAVAVKRVLAWQIEQAMDAQKLSKRRMAMATSRPQLERLLDPTNDKVQLDTILKAAKVLGRRLHIGLVEES